MPTIEGALGDYYSAGAPVTGTNAVQTLTFGSGSTGGTFRLALGGFETGNITYSTVNATLQGAIQAALDLLAPLGVNGMAVTVGTAVAGVGTFLLTCSGARVAGRVVPTLTVTSNLLTTGPTTLTVTTTTAGVEATARGAAKGARLTRLDTAVMHVNTGTAVAPTWTAQT